MHTDKCETIKGISFIPVLIWMLIIIVSRFNILVLSQCTQLSNKKDLVLETHFNILENILPYFDEVEKVEFNIQLATSCFDVQYRCIRKPKVTKLAVQETGFNVVISHNWFG